MISAPELGIGQPAFERLFSPIQVGPMQVPNRLCETTYTIGAGRGLDFLPDDAFIAHHVAKARGGIGWIGNGTWLLNAPVPDDAMDELIPGGAAMRVPLYYMPEFVPRVAQFCQAIHEAGAVAVFQLTQLNAMFGPSAVPVTGAEVLIPHELDDEEIEFIIETYAKAAAEIKEAGGDAVEVHCAHETTPHLFLSPATNRRTDRWGGDTEKRTLFVREILLRIRERVGDGLAVGLRMSGYEARAGGFGSLEAQEIAGHIGESAQPDFVSVDIGHSWGDPSYVPSSHKPIAQGADAAKAIRQVLGSIPVLYAGRVFDPHTAEDLLEKGVCDLVGVTRASVADFEFANKAREGRLEEIRYCLGCNRCIDNAVHGIGTNLGGVLQRAMCSVNTLVGNELYWRATFRRASRKQRVVVVGGGAAGLEAARVAAVRGHQVIVLERNRKLGGQVQLASVAPGREQFANLATYQEKQMELLGVDVRLGCDAQPDEVLALSPDAVICATGSVPLVPDASGLDAPNVVQGRDVLAGRAEVGHRVVVVSQEDGMETPSIAEFLAARGHEVDVFHHWCGIANQVGRYSQAAVLSRLMSRGVVLHDHFRLEKVKGSQVEFVSTLSGPRKVVEGVDTVVLSCGSRPDVDLYRALKVKVDRIYLIGAAWVPRGIHEATEHGMRVGLEV